MLQRIQSSMDSLLLRPFSASAAAPLSKHPFQGNNVEVQFSNCQPCKIPLRTLSGRYQKCRLKICMKNVNRRYGVVWRSQIEGGPNDTSDHRIGSEPEAFASRNTGNPIQTSLDALYRFSRPHTVIGTATSIISVSLLAVETMSDISLPFFIGLLEAIVAALFMNIYIVGLNQLFDIEIDKINKPYLPLASGEFSVRTGVTIISISAIMSFGIGWIVGSWPLFWALSISFVLGTAYSINLPMLRWKRFAVVAAMCILAVRAVIVQLAFFLHMQTFVFRRPSTFSRPLIFATAFMSFFSVVIALFKDIPDIDGDRIFGIKSFSVRLGQKRVFWICVYLLQMAYTAAVVIGASSSCIWSKLVMVVGHILLALILWVRAKSLDLKSKAAITSFYMFIWKLFYAEYLLIPLVR